MQQLTGTFIAIAEREGVHGSLIAEGSPGVGIDMGSHERHVALGEIVEGRTGRKDPAKQLMAALDMGLLPGSHGVAVKDTGAPRAVGSGFDRGGVGEFGAIIRKDDRNMAQKSS